MSKKHENIFYDNLFYVFVDLKPANNLIMNSRTIDEKPDFYIVPSKFVANYVKEKHEEWLRKPSRNGGKHKQTNMRLFEILDEKDIPKFLNRWDLLGL